MTVKLLLLKSGEDIIADTKEMVVGDEENPRVVGYFLHKPCVVKMTAPPPSNIPDGDKNNIESQKSSFRVTLFPWMPLSKDNTIPVAADWVVTMVTPTDKLNDMYMEDVMNYGKNDKNNSTNDATNSDQSD